MLSRGFAAPLKEERLFPIYRWKWDFPSLAHSSGGWAGNVPKRAWLSLPRSCAIQSAQTLLTLRPPSIPDCLPFHLTPGTKGTISHAPKCLISWEKSPFCHKFFLTSLWFEKAESSMEKSQSKKIFPLKPSWQLYQPCPLCPGRYLE